MSTKETLGVKLPEVKFNKNGYEIRTQMLEWHRLSSGTTIMLSGASLS